ncbi:MAG TPA: lactate utilization protein [Casimicrobiaceae bacterium]|nr:lactate utilization protein [Casimicrobiaceae bacterium]
MSIDDNQLAREAVLARVRAALGREGPDDDARAAAHAYLAAHAQGPRPAMPADLAQRFLERARDMASTVERVATPVQVPEAVACYLAPATADRAPRIVAWPEFVALDWRAAGIEIAIRVTTGDDDVGITGCFCAIAETGTLVFVAGAQTPSATFLLPDTHVAIVRVEQLVSGMEEAFARVRANGAMPRAINLVSGPSRTGDIEQTIVLGAHGPRRVHIILVG